MNKKGDNYCKTSNIIKSEKKLLKTYHRLINIHQNYLHQTTSEIVKRKPSFICIEDLNVSEMMKNKKDLKLTDCIYRCECGNVIDRDYQASINLKRYEEKALESVV